MTPKEDPADKAARLRERRMSQLEATRTAQETASGLTTDLRSVYGLASLMGMPGATSTAPVKTSTTHGAIKAAIK